MRQKEVKMKDIAIVPKLGKRLTITLPEETPIEKVRGILLSIPSALLEEVSVLDIFRTEKLGKDKKNATFILCIAIRRKPWRWRRLNGSMKRL